MDKHSKRNICQECSSQDHTLHGPIPQKKKSNIIKQPRWKTVEYSKGEINRAGDTLRKEDASKEDKEKAEMIVDNWRAAHAFPLHVIYVHLRRMAKGHNSFIVAERLKRLKSIKRKLRDNSKGKEHMLLSRMQDLGGCRVIVPTVEDVYKCADEYEHSRKRHVLKENNHIDYIKTPKDNGYRSLHRVYKYRSDNKDSLYNDMLIEIQFRTHLQHIWATAVETMGIFMNEDLKSGYGSKDVKRFFVLVSSLFAIMENQPIVPGTSNQTKDLVRELKEIDARNSFLDFLSGINVATHFQKSKFAKNTSYFILRLDYKTHALSVVPFKASEFIKATVTYHLMEAASKRDNKDIVLVQVSDLSLLRSAYPNYFSDNTEFIKTVKLILEKNGE